MSREKRRDWCNFIPHFPVLGSTWLSRESRIIVRRALAGQHPETTQQVIDRLEQTSAGWNEEPTPFVG